MFECFIYERARHVIVVHIGSQAVDTVQGCPVDVRTITPDVTVKEHFIYTILDKIITNLNVILN